MVKLTYVNRKSDGVKLGLIVAKDLRKRLKPALTSPKSDSHKDASSLELYLEGKALTDDGIHEAAKGLKDFLSGTDVVVASKLQVLHLSKNGLTVKALSTLAPCVEAAAHDLEDIDLSHNQIRVATDDDEVHWDVFLQAFGSCRVLKKLDLTGNNFSGSKALETFCNNYIRQFRRIEGHLDTFSDASSDFSSSPQPLMDDLHNLHLSGSKGQAARKSTDGPASSTVTGLPCIHTITLANTSLTDPGVLFLSYTLNRHVWAQHKLANGVLLPVNTEQPPSIDYSANEGISAGALKMLKFAEMVVYDPFESSETPFGPENSPVATTETSPTSRTRKMSAVYHHRPSVSPALSSHHSQNATIEELESIRRRMQRTILEDDGPGSVHLWHAALRLLSHARQILLGHGPSLEFQELHGIQYPQFPKSAAYPPLSPSKLHHDTTAQAPERAVVGVSNEPVIPVGWRKTRRRRDSFSVGSDSPPTKRSVADMSNVQVLPGSVNMSSLNKSQIHMIGPLSDVSWKIVMGMLSDPKGLLTEAQKRAIFAYAKDKYTLVQEREVLGKPDGVQIWRVLDAMNCLSYH